MFYSILYVNAMNAVKCSIYKLSKIGKKGTLAMKEIYHVQKTEFKNSPFWPIAGAGFDGEAIA